MVEIIGLIAAFCTTIGFLPQVIKAWRSKSTSDVSLPMLGIFAAGVLLWLIYGIALDSLPIILANSLTFILVSLIIKLKLKYK